MTFVTWIWTWKMRALAHNVWAPRLSPLPRALVGLRARYADMSVCVACSLINTQTVGGCPRRRPVAASPPLAECGGSRGSSGPLSSSRVSWIMGPPWPWRNATSDGPGPGPGPGLHLSKKVGARARVLLEVMSGRWNWRGMNSLGQVGSRDSPLWPARSTACLLCMVLRTDKVGVDAVLGGVYLWTRD